MSRSSTGVRVAAVLLLIGAATSMGARAVFAQDTAGDTIAADEPATPGANASRLDSLRERAAELRARILRLRIEFGVRLDRLESGLVFRVPEAADRERPGGEALQRLGSVVDRHYTGARLGVRTSGGGSRCGSAAEERRTRRVIRRLTGPIGFEATRVVPADCERLRPARAREAGDRNSGWTIFLLVDRSPPTGGTS